MYRVNEGNTGQGLPSEVIDVFLKGFENRINQYWIWTEPYYNSDSFELECDDLSAYDVVFFGATTGSVYLDEHIVSEAEEEKYQRNLYEGDEIDEEKFDDYLGGYLGKVKYTITLQPDNDGVFIILEAYYGENTWDTLYQEDFYLRDVDEIETAGADIADKMNWIYNQNN